MQQTQLYNEVIHFLSGAAQEQGNFSTDMLNSIRNGKISLQNSEIYIRKKLQPSGMQDLFEAELQKIPGENLFDGNKLDTGRYFIVTGMRVTYGVADKATNRALVDYGNNLPTTLLNAQLTQKQDSKIFLDLPVKSIHDALSTDSYSYNLNKFILLRDNKVLNAEIRYPQNADLGLAADKSGYIEIRYKGFQTFTNRK